MGLRWSQLRGYAPTRTAAPQALAGAASMRLSSACKRRGSVMSCHAVSKLSPEPAANSPHRCPLLSESSG